MPDFADRNLCFVHALQNVVSLRIAKRNLSYVVADEHERQLLNLQAAVPEAEFFVKHVAERGNKRGSNADCARGLIDVIGFKSGSEVSMVHEHDDDYHYYGNSLTQSLPLGEFLDR